VSSSGRAKHIEIIAPTDKLKGAPARSAHARFQTYDFLGKAH